MSTVRWIGAIMAAAAVLAASAAQAESRRDELPDCKVTYLLRGDRGDLWFAQFFPPEGATKCILDLRRR